MVYASYLFLFFLPRTIQMTYCIYLITNFDEYTLCVKQNSSCNWLANGICILCKLALRYTTIFDAFSTNSDNRRAVLSFREKNNAHRAEKFITCEFSLYLKTEVLFRSHTGGNGVKINKYVLNWNITSSIILFLTVQIWIYHILCQIA